MFELFCVICHPELVSGSLRTSDDLASEMLKQVQHDISGFHLTFTTVIHIEQITPELTWQLRRDVLYPGNYVFDMGMDEDLEGYHFGAFTDTKLIGVVSLFPQGESWQFRKFAIDTEFQGQGIGKLLLNYISEFAKSEGAVHLWCNARISALGFYDKFGFAPTGEAFSKGGIDYEIIGKTL